MTTVAAGLTLRMISLSSSTLAVYIVLILAIAVRFSRVYPFRACCLLFALLAQGVGVQIAWAETPVDIPAAIREQAMKCGPNSLYVLLRLNGVQVSFDDVSRLLPIGAAGTNLRQMRDAAEKLGLDCEVRRLSTSELEALSVAVVAHCRSAQIGSQTGHFVVVLPGTGQVIEEIDGQSGRRRSVSRHYFKTVWTGYALVPNPTKNELLQFVVTLFFAAILGGCLIGVVLRRLSKSPSTAQALAVAVGVFLPAQLTEAGERWRTPNNDGLNCLYLLLRTHGVDAGYDDLEKSTKARGECMNLLSLRKSVEQHGLGAQVIKTNLTDLREYSFPIIAYMDGSLGEGSGFVLLLEVNGSSCSYVEGGYATINEVSDEQFRRTWTGYALVTSEPGLSWSRDLPFIFLVAAMTYALCVVVSSRWAKLR